MNRDWVNWRELAACADEDPELFFPIGSGVHAERQTAQAKQVCAGCPVIGRCRDVATVRGYEGIWGGTDDSQRRAFRVRRTPLPEKHPADALPDLTELLIAR